MVASKLARRTGLVFNGLRIYDLDLQNANLVAVGGPDGVDPWTIDPANMPDGFRWITESEWEEAQEDTADIVFYSQNEHWRQSYYIGGLVESALTTAGAGEEACYDVDFDDLLDELQCDVINFLEDRGYSVFFYPWPQRHGIGEIVDTCTPEQQEIIEKALKVAVAVSKPAYERRAASLVQGLLESEQDKQDALRLALFDEAVDLLKRAVCPVGDVAIVQQLKMLNLSGDVAIVHQLKTLKTLKDDINRFLDKLNEK